MVRRSSGPLNHSINFAELVTGILQFIECSSQDCARGVNRVGEVDDLHANLPEFPFQTHPLLGSLPVVALEKVGETDFTPDVYLVGNPLNVYFVNTSECTDYLSALFEGNDTFDPFCDSQHLVADHPGNEVVALLLRAPQDVQVTYVKEIVRTGGITYSLTQRFPQMIVAYSRLQPQDQWKRRRDNEPRL